MTDFELFSEWLHYEPSTGVLTWKKDRPHKSTAWKEAGHCTPGSSGKRSYRRILFNGKKYLSHRVVWLLATGEWPEHGIDHKDGDGLNNKMENLRDVTNMVNAKNTVLHKNNKTGISGVCWIKKTKQYMAYINHNSYQHILGSFNGFLEACCTRKSAENKFGYHANHGRANNATIGV